MPVWSDTTTVCVDRVQMSVHASQWSVGHFSNLTWTMTDISARVNFSRWNWVQTRLRQLVLLTSLRRVTTTEMVLCLRKSGAAASLTSVSIDICCIFVYFNYTASAKCSSFSSYCWSSWKLCSNHWDCQHCCRKPSTIFCIYQIQFLNSKKYFSKLLTVLCY